jgi:uncharacterized protein (TIGR04255 family)
VGRVRSRVVDYGEPPVVEVAMSVLFDPPDGFTVAHLGRYWGIQKNTFPNVKAIQPIISPNEDFGAEGPWLPPSLRLAFSDEPQCRLQMTTADDQWMCQVQPDRLVMNWRKKVAEYPRFDMTLNRFKEAWQVLHRFLADEGISLPTARLWELTYVNRIPKGELWQSPDDWPAVFPGLWGGRFVAADGLTLRGLRGQWVWDFAPEQARLYVEPSPAKSAEDPRTELLMLSLTSRGPIRLKEESGAIIPGEVAIEDGMNLGHDLIVFTFDTCASSRAKEIWKRHA